MSNFSAHSSLFVHSTDASLFRSCFRVMHVLSQRMDSWTASLRDENFLESTVLRDYAGDDESERAAVAAERVAVLLRAEVHDRLGIELRPEQAERIVHEVAAGEVRHVQAPFALGDISDEENEAADAVPSSNTSTIASEDLAAARIDEVD